MTPEQILSEFIAIISISWRPHEVAELQQEAAVMGVRKPNYMGFTPFTPYDQEAE